MYDFIFNRQKKRRKIIINESETVVRHWGERARDIMVRNYQNILKKHGAEAPSGGLGQAQSFDQYRCKDTTNFQTTKNISKKRRPHRTRRLPDLTKLDVAKYKKIRYSIKSSGFFSF